MSEFSTFYLDQKLHTLYIYWFVLNLNFERKLMWAGFIALGVLYTLQNIQENTQRYMETKTRSELFAERNVHKAFPITTICLNSMHSKRESKVDCSSHY